jgi:SPP1 gp7 family putative phage head morphogenesis protein
MPNTLEGAKSFTTLDDTAKALHGLGKCDCGNHEKVKKDSFTDEEIAQLNKDLDRLVGIAQRQLIDAAAREFILEAFGENYTPLQRDSSPMKDGYRDMIYEALKWAYDKGLTTWDVLPDGTKRRLIRGGLTSPELIPPATFKPGDEWIRTLYNDGFQLVRANITKRAIPDLKRIMVRDLTNGVNWKQIARNIYNEVYIGKLWKAEMIARTELAIAIDKSSRYQYETLAVPMVHYIAAANPCPICERYATTNGGIYKLDNSPLITADTHPHCRCLISPVWRTRRNQDPGVPDVSDLR